ncbi:hypothetical protein ACLB0R_02875 [Sphingomonas sp. GlSt437]|uniref:hypothetical protein n=1 Tax=Sphingomonas sp. GlSt437 TaxID=3389970 RepID=UPI003A8AD90A
MRTILVPLTLAALLPLAACDKGGDGTSISIRSDNDNVTADVDGNSGKLALNVPGFQGSISLPKVHLGGNNFDIDGVHLYPGSSIKTMNVDAHDDDSTGKDADGTVHIVFDSPADTATVRDWFREKMKGASFKVNDDGSGLSGTTKDGKAFKLELTGSDKGQSHGMMTISG